MMLKGSIDELLRDIVGIGDFNRACWRLRYRHCTPPLTSDHNGKNWYRPCSASLRHCQLVLGSINVASSASAFELLTRFAACPRPGRMGDAGANICSMLEADEVALARAELHVIEARGRVSDQLAKIARLKGFGESSLEAEQEARTI